MKMEEGNVELGQLSLTRAELLATGHQLANLSWFPRPSIGWRLGYSKGAAQIDLFLHLIRS